MDAQTVDELIANEYPPVHAVRAAIKQLRAAESDDTADLLHRLQTYEAHLKRLYKSKEIHFIPLQEGRLGIGGRPGLGKVAQFPELGIDVVVTLLKEKEKDVPALGEAVQRQGIAWIWFPLAASQLPTDPASLQKTTTLFDRLQEQLAAGKTIFIHCAAGVHRTGAFTNAFLQYQGYDPATSRQLVKEMREVTAREAVVKHWRWADVILQYRETVSPL
ncbi:MAG TPA: hypothetical protein ENJ93_03580 [Chloroflexi bacterium]|nr:hypothetical protein [Chloroflexota bacterium]